ncbi:hypothetical protein, partial [Pontibacter saemangeumensis]|uniref:hypothetical protein n=1 Tax=Pontibacter saemangeumensis TaxID=1084525 RepID=UPI0031ECCCA2
MKKITIKAIRNKFKRHYFELIGRPPVVAGPFEQRIKHRHKTFWSPRDAEWIRNTAVSAGDPLEKWRDVEHWQRKLSNKRNSREFAR